MARGRGRGGPPPRCAQRECFDPLVRRCVDCSLLRTPAPGPGPGPGSPPGAPRLPPARPSPLPGPLPGSPRPPAAEPSGAGAAGPAGRPEAEAGGAGPGAGDGAPLPALLLGAPALLGLALALVLLAALGWRRLRRPAPPKAADTQLDELPDSVLVLSSGPPDASAPAWPPPGEDPATMPPTHSVPVPATELGSTELVTTKTAGPEK